MAPTAEACVPLGTEKRVFVDWNIVEPGYGVAWEMPSGIELVVHKPRIDDGPFLSAGRSFGTIDVPTSTSPFRLSPAS